MPQNRNIDPAISETPPQHDPTGHLPITRAEFRPVAEAVKRMERGMFGDDRYEGKGMVAEHHDMKKSVAFAKKLGWAALLAGASAIGHTVWSKATGKVP